VGTLNQLRFRFWSQLVDHLTAPTPVTKWYADLHEFVSRQSVLDLFEHERCEAAGADVYNRSEVMTEHAKEVDLLVGESHLSPVFYRLGAELK